MAPPSGLHLSHHRLPDLVRIFSIATFLSIPPILAQAQQVPNAGTLERQLRDGAPTVAPPAAPTAPARPIPLEQGADQQRLMVTAFVIDGATLIPVDDLLAQLSDRVGPDRSLRDLQAAAQVVADAYRRRGFFARAFVPAQSIKDGIVHIQVVEGRFGSMRRKAQPDRADADFVANMVGTDLKPGQPYSLDDLERGLLLANDLPGVAVDGTLTAGTELGASDLVLDINDRPLISASLGGSNAGARATGAYLGAAAASINGATGQGDQLNTLVMKSQGIAYGLASFAVPLGSDGWRMKVSSSVLTYRLNGDFHDLRAHGLATTQGAEISYPLIRSSTRNQRLRTYVEHANYDDDALGADLHRKRVNRGGVGLGGDISDDWGGGGLTSYAVTLSGGVLDLSGLADDDAQDKATSKTGGGFTKLAVDAHRDQALTPGLFLRVRVVGQWSNQNLDSSEQMALGGPQGVRAYPVNEALSDRAMLTNVELHHAPDDDWARGLDLFAFVDAGLTQTHAHPWKGWENGGDVDNSYALAGAGLGASYAVDRDFGLSLIAAMPFGANPGVTDANRNQDGGRRGPRVWFTLTKMF